MIVKQAYINAHVRKDSYDVFISYSRKDYVDEKKNVLPGNEISKIKEALTKAGITFWFDEDGVYSGDKFAEVIVKNIKASSVFVFLSTANSNLSEWTASEISTAHMMKKKIIPVRIDNSIYHDDVILYLSRLSHIDYYENPEKGRQELVRSIKAFLENEKAALVQKAAEERHQQLLLARQQREQEENRKRQAEMEKLEVEISAQESRRTELKKAVLQKEQELKFSQIDLEACEKNLQRLHQKLDELRNPKNVTEIKQMALEAENKRKAEEQRKQEALQSSTFTVNGVSFKMIHVQGGTFMMGATEEQGDDAYYYEKPAHEVILSDYSIGETPVTQELWEAVMGNNPSEYKGKLLPVECVYDCQEFIRKLNQLTGKKFRLPSEAEWEYAARGGNQSMGYKYCGSNNIDEVAWYSVNSNYTTHPVKQKKPNELGIYDMSGNVEEWCQNTSEFYYNNKQMNPTESKSALYYVTRGGSNRHNACHCRVSHREVWRIESEEVESINDIGFRLAL